VTDERRPLADHLRDASIYEARAGVPSPGARWRRRLLDARFPRARVQRRPLAGISHMARLALFVALPVAVIMAIAMAVYAGFDFSPRWPEFLPRVELSAQEGLAPATDTLVWMKERLAPWQGSARALWWLLPALSTLLTFLARGRVPRLLPLDW